VAETPVDIKGSGPPKGSSADSPFAGVPIPLQQQRPLIDSRVGSGGTPFLGDAAFQGPVDPLTQGNAKARARLVYRDIPLVTIQNSWTPQQVISSLQAHMSGIFETSAQMVDSMLGDDRVQATLGSRLTGLFGSEVRHRAATNKRVAGSAAAKECLDAWSEWWPSFWEGFALPECHAYAIFMGWMPGQLLWDTTSDVWGPRLRPWHPRFTYYNWDVRKYVAITLDGSAPIFPGDGKWILHCPFGASRGWVRGAVRAVAEPWLIRHLAIRDWAGFSEIHGFPIRKCIAPASSSPDERNLFQAQVAQLGSNTSILLSEGLDAKNGGTSYDLQLLEATDTAWEAFPGLRDHCDMAIVLAIMFQNLTTEVKGGAFAATTSHMDIRAGGIRGDNAAWKSTLYSQVIRPFALFNFGDADLACTTDWDVRARADYLGNAEQFQKFGTAIEVLRRGGVQFKDTKALRRFARETFGLERIPEFDLVDPVASGAGGGGFGAGGSAP
jgi:phage gp29-like protein